MSQPLGEEFIKIRPDVSTFRAELQSQIATAMTGVQRQVAAATAQTGRAAAAAAGTTTASGIVLPPGVRTVAAQTAAAQAQVAQSTAQTGRAAQATNQQLQALSTTQRRAAQSTRDMQRSISQAETAVGRYSRGMLAATAASTGFFRAVSFASGAFLLGATIGASIGAAVNEFAQMTTIGATTVQLLKSTGGAANVTATQIDGLSRSVLALTGTDDELVKQGANVLLTFRNIRNEAGAGNDVFNRAVRAAADISTVFRTDLRGSALQLGKALQDPVRGVTALRRSGITLSQGQRDLIKQLAESGAVLSAQKIILGEVERQVGQTAEAIGRTLPGRLRIMREESLNSLGDLVKRLTESKTAADLAAQGAQGLSQAYAVVKATIQAVGPPLIDVAQGLGNVTQAVGGVGNILAVVAAYKAVTAGAAVAARAQGIYAAASLAGARASVAEATAAGASAAALEEQALASLAAARAAQRTLTTMVALSSVFAIGAVASGQWELALLGGGVALAGVATKARAAVLALRETGAAVTAVRVASLALGGPLGIAAVAAGALAFGLFKVWQRTRDTAVGLQRTKEALDSFNQSLDENMRLRAAVGTAREQFGVAQFDVRAADRDLQRAQERLANTRAAPGSLTFRFLQDQIRVAEENTTKATDRLADAQRNLDIAREKSRTNEQGLSEEIRKATQELQSNIAATQRLADPAAQQRVQQLTSALMLQGLAYDQAKEKAAAIVQTELQASGASQRAVDEVIKRYQKLADSTEGASHEAAAAILVIASSLNRLPTQKEIDVIVRLAGQGVGTGDILRQLGLLTHADIELQRSRATAQQRTRSVNATLREQYLIATGILKRERDKLHTISQEANARREALRSARLETAAARDAIVAAKEAQVSAREGLADAQRGLADAQRNLDRAIRGVADAQRNLNDAIRDSARAVADARQNVNDTIRESARAVADARRDLNDTIRESGQAVADARRNLADAIRESDRAVSDARTNLTDTLRESKQAVAEAIKSGRQETNQSIQDAKSNLLELNRSLAESISQFLEKTSTASDTLSGRARFLRQQVIRGGGGPETLRAAQELNFNLNAQEPAIDTDKIKRQFDDLTDSFVRGRINLRQFDARFGALTRGIDIGKFREMFGTAAANEFLDTLRTSRRQAVLIKESPKRIGGAIAQTLINPLKVIADSTRAVATAKRDAARDIADSKRALADALRTQTRNISDANRALTDATREQTRNVGDARRALTDATRQQTRNVSGAQRALRDAIRQQTRNVSDAQRGVQDALEGVADAQRGVEDAQRGIVRAEREIGRANRQLIAAERRFRQAEHKERSANTRALKQNARETKQLKDVIAARRALLEVKPKPKGGNSENANDLRAGVGP